VYFLFKKLHQTIHCGVDVVHEAPNNEGKKTLQREQNLIFDFFFAKKIKNQILLSLESFSYPQTLFVVTLYLS
jgi:hypothetical protein